MVLSVWRPALKLRISTLPWDETKIDGFAGVRARRGPGYDVAYFRKKQGLTTLQAARIVRDANGDRGEADVAAWRLKKGL